MGQRRGADLPGEANRELEAVEVELGNGPTSDPEAEEDRTGPEVRDFAGLTSEVRTSEVPAFAVLTSEVPALVALTPGGRLSEGPLVRGLLSEGPMLRIAKAPGPIWDDPAGLVDPDAIPRLATASVPIGPTLIDPLAAAQMPLPKSGPIGRDPGPKLISAATRAWNGPLADRRLRGPDLVVGAAARKVVPVARAARAVAVLDGRVEEDPGNPDPARVRDAAASDDFAPMRPTSVLDLRTAMPIAPKNRQEARTKFRTILVTEEVCGTCGACQATASPKFLEKIALCEGPHKTALAGLLLNNRPLGGVA